MLILSLSLFSARIIDNLRTLPFAPSVQAQEVPKDFSPDDYIEGEDSEAEEADIRRTRKFFIIYIKEIKKKERKRFTYNICRTSKIRKYGCIIILVIQL